MTCIGQKLSKIVKNCQTSFMDDPLLALIDTSKALAQQLKAKAFYPWYLVNSKLESKAKGQA